jgi:hypothetical protein
MTYAFLTNAGYAFKHRIKPSDATSWRLLDDVDYVDLPPQSQQHAKPTDACFVERFFERALVTYETQMGKQTIQKEVVVFVEKETDPKILQRLTDADVWCDSYQIAFERERVEK